MNKPRQFITAALVLAAAAQAHGYAAAAENCVFQIHGTEEPYTVLGTLVVPQSNYLIVSGCDKTADQVRADLLAPSQERALEMAQEQARAKAAREEGDALVQARQRQRIIDAGKKAGVADLWAWIQGWFGQSST